MKRPPRPPCPRPDKVAHASRRDAHGAAQAWARELISAHRTPEPIYGYECVCGRWHLTRREEWSRVPNVLLWTAPPELIAWAVNG